MTNPREAFLQRVRRAVAEGNKAGRAAPLPARGNVGYQGGGPDPVSRFRDELAAAGVHAHVVVDRPAAVAKVLHILAERSARRCLLGRGDFIDVLPLRDKLCDQGLEVVETNSLEGDAEREAYFAADVGISGVDYLIAETGSVVLLTRPDQPRSLSLLPPIHVAVAHRGQLLPDLFDLFAPERWPNGPPACVSVITGPSKTGDIELRLVTGVHGPGEVHVVLLDENPANPGNP
jgi:L-lactate utilization protein LutC